MFKTIALAGTFDCLHKGHEFFLSQAFKLGERVIIGITSDGYAEEKFSIFNFQFSIKVNTYIDRKSELEDFLRKQKLLDRAEIVRINDIYGPAVENKKIEALVVTRETLKGGRLVKKRRKELGLKPLKVIQVPFVKADDGRRISTTRIRMGEIDRMGRKFKVHPDSIGTKFKVNENIRLKLKKLLGELIRGKEKDLHCLEAELKKRLLGIDPVMIITVGDQVTRLCNEMRMEPDVAIVDFRVQRKKIYKRYGELGFQYEEPHHRIKNPAGYITRTLAKAVDRAIRHFTSTGTKQLIRVIGEEDLAGVPAILRAPLGAVVLYGQPNEGVVLVEVTEEKKKEMRVIIEQLD